MKNNSSYNYKRKHRGRRLRLALLFSAMIFVIIVITLITVTCILLALHKAGVLKEDAFRGIPFILFNSCCIVVGSIFAFFISSKPLKPIRILMDAVDRIADGDYSVRIQFKGPEEFRELSRRFNHMAEELDSVEMLSSDFVNNFSHEFKTPIVSVRGFARMLKREDLSDEEREEYLDIIIEESERLADLATNVLNLSKLEKQVILTDKTRFNVSEQIRLCIALLDHKWTGKHIDISADCQEIELRGNEELLKQVWINLLDNAAKFAPEGTRVKVCAWLENENACITVTNSGNQLTREMAERIFDKFYQADTSHSEKGNGLGLTIARRIVEMHQGRLYVCGLEGEEITFRVELPVG